MPATAGYARYSRLCSLEPAMPDRRPALASLRQAAAALARAYNGMFVTELPMEQGAAAAVGAAVGETAGGQQGARLNHVDTTRQKQKGRSCMTRLKKLSSLCQVRRSFIDKED